MKPAAHQGTPRDDRPGPVDDVPRPRVRVTAPTRTAPTGDGPLTTSKAAESEAEAVFVRGLIRAQLRLAVGHAIGCCLGIAVLAVVAATLPPLHTATLWGVPWSWILQAYGPYPLVAAFGFAYVRAAVRNEQRYRALRGPE